MKLFGNEHDFAERKRIDERPTVVSEIDMVLRKDNRFVHNEASEDHPEVEGDNEIFF
jgi:hypothetical protein